MFKPIRLGIIFTIMAIMLTIYVSALYRMQIYEERPTEEELFPLRPIIRAVTMTAARGNIYDRNGVLLASGRPSYKITLNRDTMVEYPNARRNEIVRELVFTSMDEGVQYNDSFPITKGAPFTYMTNMTTSQRVQLEAYIAFFEQLDPDITASDLLAWMRGHYGIDFTTSITEARLIIGVRYEIEMRAILHNLPPYVFADDVSTHFISNISERSLDGVFIESSYVREYHTANAPHLIGYIGPIPYEEYERYNDLGYPADAIVGITGAEYVFEEALRGINGFQYEWTNTAGSVVDITSQVEPIPGQHVYLTIDIGLQVAAEDALRSHIESSNLEIDEENEKITGGAVVVSDVWTGEVLAAATYPSYNRFTLSQDAPTLFNDPNKPMVNRATQELYSPGSTFKMITGLAALRHGIVGRHTIINDVGIYDVYESFQPTCWIFPTYRVGHGNLDIVEAITCSCNYFFISCSDRIAGGGESGAEAIAEVALEFGLGRKTGIEIPDLAGILATPEWKETELDEGWWRADTLQVSFGQGFNRFTPIQMANYVATIANGGTLYNMSVLRRLVSSDMSEVLYTHEPTIISEFPETSYLEIIREGMQLVTRSRNGTANRVFGDYPIDVAAKTGTVQIETEDINTGVFVCYAPTESPEIAISIVIERGGSGSAVMDIARVILDYYFGSEMTAFTVPFGELIP